MGEVSGLKLFDTKSGVTEVMPCLADVQDLVEGHMQTMLGVRFLASEYGTGPVEAGSSRPGSTRTAPRGRASAWSVKWTQLVQRPAQACVLSMGRTSPRSGEAGLVPDFTQGRDGSRHPRGG